MAAGPVHLIQIDIIGSQAFETALAGGANGGGRQVPSADFGGDDGFGAPALEGASEHLFRVAIAVALSCVEEIDAAVERGLNGADGVRFVLRAPIVAADDAPKAYADWRDHQ